MASDEIFDLFHKYNRLVRREMAKPLMCWRCRAGLVTSLDKNDELVLICYLCGAEVAPGTALIDQVRKTVVSYYE